MKLIPSIGFSDFSGSAGNVTARKVGDKTYLSTRTKHSRIKTPDQASIRCRFADTVRSYADITEEQRQGWISLANNLGSYATSSGSTSITGHNLFVAINSYRKICGKPLTADAPAQLLPSQYINVDDLWLSPEHIVFTDIVQSEDPNAVLLIEMYPAQSPAESRCWNQTVIVAVCPTTDWGDVDITDSFLRKFGTPLTIGQMVFIKICWINSECGYIKWHTMFAHTAREASIIHNAEYIPRAQITIDQIESITQNSKCEYFDYELSPGSKFTSNNITAKRLQGMFMSCEFPHNGLPDVFSNQRSIQYSRGTVEMNYFIQCMDVYIQNNDSKKISINCRAGYFKDHFETFGTYYVTN